MRCEHDTKICTNHPPQSFSGDSKYRCSRHCPEISSRPKEGFLDWGVYRNYNTRKIKTQRGRGGWVPKIHWTTKLWKNGNVKNENVRKQRRSLPKGTPRVSIARRGGALGTLGLKIRGLWRQCLTTQHRVPGHEIAVTNRKRQESACWERGAHVTGALDERSAAEGGRGPKCVELTQTAVKRLTLEVE